MTLLTSENLHTTLTSFHERGSYASACASIGCRSESTLWGWQQRSKQAAAAGDRESIWFLSYQEQPPAFYHEWVQRCRSANAAAQLHLAVETNKLGIEEEVRDPATGRRLPKLAPEFLGVSDEAMIDQLLDPVRDRWEWRLNDAGERVEPVWETRFVHAPASLRAKFFAGLLPKTFGEKSQIDVTHKSVVNIRVEPAPFVPRVAPPIDAEFRELPIERQDIAELRAHAARLLADPNRASARASRPVNLGVVGPDLPPTRSDASETDGAAQPRGSAAVPPTIIDPVRVRAPAPVARAPVEMAPESKPAPSYQRRHSQWGAEDRDPTRPGAVAMKVG